MLQEWRMRGLISSVHSGCIHSGLIMRMELENVPIKTWHHTLFWALFECLHLMSQQLCISIETMHRVVCVVLGIVRQATLVQKDKCSWSWDQHFAFPHVCMVKLVKILYSMLYSKASQRSVLIGYELPITAMGWVQKQKFRGYLWHRVKPLIWSQRYCICSVLYNCARAHTHTHTHTHTHWVKRYFFWC